MDRSHSAKAGAGGSTKAKAMRLSHMHFDDNSAQMQHRPRNN